MCVDAGDGRGSARQKHKTKGAFHEVVPDALMGALLSSGKVSSSSLRKTKRSSIIQLGKAAAAGMAIYLETDGLGN
jgi:hypothetical protein